MSGDFQAAAVDHEFGTFGDAGIDIAAHLVAVRAGHQGTHIRVALAAGTDAQRLHHRLEARDQCIRRRIADADGDRNRHATFAGGTVTGAQQCVRGLVHVGVGHDHHVVLGATQGLYALAGGAAARIQVFGDRRGADEADGLHARVVQQRVHRFLVAVHDVEHAVRQAGFLQQAGQDHGRRRIAFRGFQHEAVAAGDRDGKHPHRHHAGEIERRDAGDHAERRVLAPAVDAAADIHRMLALEQMRDAAGELHHFHAAGQLAARIRQHLAVLGSNGRRDFIGMPFQQFLELEQHARTIERRHRRPGRERPGCGFYRRFDFRFRRQRDATTHAAGRGIVDVAGTPAVARDFVSVDEVRERSGRIGHGVRPGPWLPARTRNRDRARPLRR